MATVATGPTDGGSSRTPHSERVLASLLAPAASIIRAKGILGASVEDLVEVVGVSKGTLYYHIRTKEGLLYWIHESVTRDGYERWVKAIEDTREAPAATTLGRLIEEHTAVIHDYRDCVAVMNEEMKYLPGDMQRTIKARRAEYQGLLESVLQKGVSQGEFKIESVHQIASMMIGTLNSMYRWYTPDGELSVAEIAKITTDLFLHGLLEG